MNNPFKHNLLHSTFIEGCATYSPFSPKLTLWGDCFPGVWRVHESSVLDLVMNVFILIKGEGSTETDIDDDTHWPHVQRAVVALVAKHLRGEVRWGTYHRTPKRLLTNNTCKTEITQLHLQDKPTNNELYNKQTLGGIGYFTRLGLRCTKDQKNNILLFSR